MTDVVTSHGASNGVNRTVAEEAGKCVRCGACRAVCPIFDEEHREGAGARGKISLAQARVSGEVGSSGRFRQEMNQCLLCLACTEACPNDVRTDEIVLASRSSISKSPHERLLHRLVFEGFLPSVSLLTHGIRLASLFQGILFQHASGEDGMRRNVPLPWIRKDRVVPRLADVFLLEEFRDTGESALGERVGFFAGCMINYMYTGIGRKTVGLIRRAGSQPVLPKGQACCGLPALGFGDMNGARALAVKNLEEFETSGVDAIVAACASCGSTLKHYYPGIISRDDPGLFQRMKAFSSKVMDISEFLVEKGFQPSHKDVRVTYHDPCHLRRGMGVRDAPRLLIEAAVNSGFAEMDNPCRCCGFGGSFNLKYYDFSSRVREKKIASILDTGADVLITGCPGCMMNIRDGLIHAGAGSDVAVRHLVDLLD